MYARYFAKIMSISQSYNQGNHKKHMPEDYPIDETYFTQNGTFYAPFNCKIVKRYSSKSNQIWITSTTEVETPTGNCFVTILIGHISPAEYKTLTLNKEFKQGDAICHEYKDALSTGPHNHVSCGAGKIKGAGWLKNKNGVWCINTTGGAKKPEELLFIDDFTTIKNTGGINWQKYDGEVEKNYTYYTTLDDLYINKEPKVGTPVSVSDCYPAMRSALKYQLPSKDAVVKKGTTITCLELVTSGKYIWIKNFNGYICLKGASGKYYCKEYK